ncbi:helix-turn-helix domain-containing protein [Catellatospora citrea]|uniref:AraC family transcriptional regulator n=1 Tax=Catellatospora citrea TaxID=53366 RepID=A0A8J3KRX7_9ACTN|nr:AraC family transcriptional regulator [Catellatospora citrea]GIG00210.1 AraC family transcriptional regulator [Catellatospora citrea]
MTAPADTFAAYVDVLAHALDEPDATGADLAGRLHLSRYHLDRLVAAVAGEPPGALRRRVLLERAAYRLATSTRTVLDVAIEAGYSSHEAFTRAFTRAYGTGPARWRRRPTGISLAAPNDVHFHPPAGLRLPGARKVHAMDLLLGMVDHHVWLLGRLLDRAAGLDDDTLDRGIELSVEGVDATTTLRSLLSRLVGQLDQWNAGMSGRDYDWSVEDEEPVAAMRARLAVAGPDFIGRVRAVSEADRLGDTFVDTVCVPPRVFTYGGMVAHVLTFAAHRRTLALGALRTAGVDDLGDGDPMSWFARAT